MKSKRGQAMVESVVAVLVIAAALLGAVHLARIVLAKATLSHAAARVARARAVGMNDFMCVKIARASAIGVSGARLWPEQVASEKALVPLYLETENAPMAHGMLEYEYWDGIDVAIDEGLAIDTAVTLHTDDFTVRGDWATEAHYPLYLK